MRRQLMILVAGTCCPYFLVYILHGSVCLVDNYLVGCCVLLSVVSSVHSLVQHQESAGKPGGHNMMHAHEQLATGYHKMLGVYL